DRTRTRRFASDRQSRSPQQTAKRGLLGVQIRFRLGKQGTQAGSRFGFAMTDIVLNPYEYEPTRHNWLVGDRINWIDVGLVFLFLIGIYTGWTLQLTPTVPVPSAIAGLAGLVLLWRRRDRIEPTHVNAFALLMFVLFASVFAAPDFNFFPKRITGLIQ